jgi:heat shock protein HslJ
MTYLSRIIILLLAFSTIASADAMPSEDILVNGNSREMTGMYSYMADAAGFIECTQEKRLPVALKADNITLERAYLENIYMPGKSLLVTFKGHLAKQNKMEGEGQEQVIIVDKFISLAQQERCHGEVPPSSLANTYWKLVELNGERLDRNEDWLSLRKKHTGAIKDIHFIIRENNLLSGFSGCNKFSSQTTFDNVAIKIAPLRSTRMACDAMILENSVQNMLQRVDTYRIKGEQLEILAGNHVVGKFIAIYF